MKTCQQTSLDHILMIRIAVVGERLDGDSPTGIEQADDLQILGIHQLDEVLHDDVHAVLVEVAVVAETEEVEFEALALHHQRAWNVINNDVPEVGLTCLGAQRGKLGTVEGHQVIVLRMLVLKGLEHFGRIVVTILGILITQ